LIRIDSLADHLETIPTLVKWFREQWPDYYADRPDAEMEQDFLSDASRHCLPSRLVAFDSNELAGTIVLRERGTATPAEFQPELGGLNVLQNYRGQGIGTELVRSGMQLALNHGYETVFVTTVVASGILERLGWEFIKIVEHQDGPLSHPVERPSLSGMFSWVSHYQRLELRMVYDSESTTRCNDHRRKQWHWIRRC
jgi:N-acetylglutamate synthase-like GNAT family acetyltransferase